MPDIPDVGDGCAGCFTAPMHIFSGLGDLACVGGGGSGEMSRREVAGLCIFFVLASIIAAIPLACHQYLSSGRDTIKGTVVQVAKQDRSTVLVEVEVPDGRVLKIDCDKGIKPEKGVPYEFIVAGTVWEPFREYQSVVQWTRLDKPEAGMWSWITGGPKMEAETHPPSDLSFLLILCAVIGGICLLVVVTMVISQRFNN